ncbi:MAG TPA: hypothetical protein PK199_07825 [Bacteroidales bacterium]|nr:hypothetical protein [Bacteroidales bacterium]
MIRYIKYILLLAVAYICAMCESKMYDPNSEMGSPVSPGLPGKGGSMARFTISDSILYVLRDGDVIVYDIANPNEIVEKTRESINWGMETIFPYDSLLFFGSQSGMYVYKKEGYNLEYITDYQHITSCDPVVFDGRYAYVTLNDDMWMCNRGVNELHVIDMQTITNPKLEKTYTMESPKGLGVDGDLLFVCDNNTLRVYDKTNVNSLELLANFDEMEAYDVIPYNNYLILTGMNGISQYSYNKQSKTIQLASTILVSNQ